METILHAQHPDDNRNIYSVRKRIRDTFESTDCFLMPSPSETVREGEARKLKGMLSIRNIALLGIDLSDVYPL